MTFEEIISKLPKPYYRDNQKDIVIYNADCRDLLPLIPDKSIDLVLTDPPYGIGKDGQKLSTGGHGGRKAYEFMGWDSCRPDDKVFKLLLNKSINQIIWGGNYFADLLPSTSKWLVWDKGQRINQSDGELAWTSFEGALRICTLNRVELMLDYANHPTQKPLKLITWCLSLCPSAITVVDTFLGSGTTAVASKILGRKCIGIEIEEKYCEIAAKRLSQGVMNLSEPINQEAF